MARVAHFEIHADNPERTAQFYRDVFGWQIQKWAGPVEYWLITTGTNEEPGINGGLMKRRGSAAADGAPVNSYVCTINVDSIDQAISRITQNGGNIVAPKMPIPGVGWSAYAKDTDGNIFGVHQQDSGAK